jgi:hypothetical protein
MATAAGIALGGRRSERRPALEGEAAQDLGGLFALASRAGDDVVVGVDELFELVLAGITDVFVDRHVDTPCGWNR